MNEGAQVELDLDRGLLNACVQCGLCLSSCPTYRVTGDESASPRGRIALMRAVQDDGLPLTAEVVDSFETCIQCRGCEPACPSDVRFGELMEHTRQHLAAGPRGVPWWERLALRIVERPRLLRALTRVAAATQRVVPLPRRLGLPRRLPLRRPGLPSGRGEVVLFTGCVMDAWQREVHLATLRVLDAVGTPAEATGDAGGCCGALHLHAGLAGDARRLAEAVIGAMDDRPVLVNAAGCGAALKDYGRLLRTADARRFSSQVLDVHEWLAERVDRIPEVVTLDLRVAIQDPCHLRHVQRAHHTVRSVLRPVVRELVELDDEGLCCGAGGAYAMTRPDLAGQVRALKTASVARAGVDVVASANPGCVLHLRAAGVPAFHPLEIVDRAMSGRSLMP